MPPPSTVKIELSQLTIDTIRSVLSVLCPTARIRSLQLGPPSYSNRLWLADTDEGDLLVRVPGRDADPEYVRASVVSSRLAAEAGVPAPRIRAFAAWTEIGLPVVVQEYRPGERATLALERNPGLAEVFGSAVGDWVGTLHHVHGEGFGSVLDPRQHDSWPSAVRAQIRAALNAVPADALPAPSGVIQAEFEDLLARLQGGQPASLVHGDLYFDNVLAHHDAPIGLIDFEHARFADRFADFGKLNELLFEWWPGTREPFLQAYAEHFPPEPDDEVRRGLGIGLYELSQLAYFQRWQQDLVPVYRSRLGAWLTAQTTRSWP